MTVINVDCLEGFSYFPDNCFDSIVCDPPYELGFMGKSWDSTGIAYNVAMWREALRVLKHGGHLLAFSGSRTYHRMTCAIEDAGFEIRDQIMWVYGSGFPKSLDVSKAIDKVAGAERRVTPVTRRSEGNAFAEGASGFAKGEVLLRDEPATEAARQWDGWGTALKPAHEPICMARKPLIGTVAANVLEHGVGAINIDECRLLQEGTRPSMTGGMARKGSPVFGTYSNTEIEIIETDQGRWPANFIHDGLHDEWSRYFYCAKASKKDRNEGLENFEQRTDSDGALRDGGRESEPRANIHPTVKPTDLMRYLVRLVTPPGGKTLDPFAGSGSTGKAAKLEGFHFTGFELSAEYTDIANRRIDSV